MELFIGVMIFLMGLCAGSFVNMLIYRTAVRYKLRKGLKSKVKNESRSFCDYCGNKLSWYENIPVLSWVIQSGKTRCCQKKLDRSYPLVELLTGILFETQFLILNLKFLNNLELINYQNILVLVVGMVIVTLLVFLAVFDLKYMILPDFGTVFLISGAILLLIINNSDIYNYGLAAVGATGFLGLIHLATKGKGMGLGDVKYAVFMGLLLGLGKTILAFYVAFIVGAIVAVGLMMLGRAGKKSQIAFGPFLILGTVVAWWWGETIIKIFNFQIPIFK